MSERGPVDQETLESSFRLLAVRDIMADDWYWGPGRIGSSTPTRKAWAEGRPQQLGSDISRLLASGETALRVYAAGDDAIHRREQHAGFNGKPYTRLLELNDPITDAEITGIVDVRVGKGKLLPLLRLLEYGPWQPEEFALSLSDLADYIQKDQVKIAVA